MESSFPPPPAGTRTCAQGYVNRVNVHGYQGSGGLVPRWNTVTTGGSDLYTSHSDIHLSGKTLSVPFTAKSVQTLQVDGVTV